MAKERRVRWILALAATLAWTSCGDSVNSSKCAAACKAPTTGPCAGQDETACRDTCVGMTSGLKTECVQCLAESSGWKGLKCTCLGKPCTICGFSPGEDACQGPAPDEECTVAQEKCTGFEIYKTTGSKCKAVCGVSADGSTSTGRSDH